RLTPRSKRTSAWLPVTFTVTLRPYFRFIVFPLIYRNTSVPRAVTTVSSRQTRGIAKFVRRIKAHGDLHNPARGVTEAADDQQRRIQFVITQDSGDVRRKTGRRNIHIDGLDHFTVTLLQQRIHAARTAAEMFHDCFVLFPQIDVRPGNTTLAAPNTTIGVHLDPFCQVAFKRALWRLLLEWSGLLMHMQIRELQITLQLIGGVELQTKLWRGMLAHHGGTRTPTPLDQPEVGQPAYRFSCGMPAHAEHLAQLHFGGQ